MRRLPILVLTALALIGAGAGAQAAAPTERPVPGLPVYLALGDSIAFGQESVPRAVDAATTFARWRANGYAARFHDELVEDLDCLPAASSRGRDGCRQLQHVNFARTATLTAPGVTTHSMLEPGGQLERAESLLLDRNQDANPRNDVEVITLTVGGNDVFGPITAACTPTPTATCVPTILSSFAGFEARYDQILARLRAAAGPDTEILTMTYYNPLPFCERGAGDPVLASALGAFVLEGTPLPPLGQLPEGLNEVIERVSAEYGAVRAETYGLLGAEDFVGGEDCLHPDGTGHEKIAGAFDLAFGG